MRIDHLISIIRVLPLALLSIGLSSCSDSGSEKLELPSEPQVTRKWTVFYYGAGNDSTDVMMNGGSRVVSGVNELEQSRFGDEISVLACLTTPAIGGQTSIYEIGFFPNAEGSVASRQIANWGTSNTADTTLLRSFVEMGTSLYRAEKYILLINGSGNGVAGTCQDSQFQDVLTLTELRTSLESVMIEGTPVHFDLIGWLAPEMGTIEVAYELHNLTDYMAAGSWIQPFEYTDGLRQWMFDFAANPNAGTERIGSYLVDGVFESAEASESDYRYTLWDLSMAAELAPVVNQLAAGLVQTIDNESLRILSARDSAFEPDTDDPSTVDLAAFVAALGSDSAVVNSISPQLTDDVISGVDAMVVYTRSTRRNDERPGLSIYFPVDAEEELDSARYNDLLMSEQHSGWKTFLDALRELSTSRTTIRGTVYWPGKPLDGQFRLFPNTAQSGGAVIPFSIPIVFTDFFHQDSAAYEIILTLQEESMNCYLGVFRDVDGETTLSSGDSLGYYRLNSPLRDWITIHRSAVLENMNVTVNRRQ